jgi:hypothetical protein
MKTFLGSLFFLFLLNEGILTVWADTPATCTPTKLSDEYARILLYASPIAWDACCKNKKGGDDVRNELMVSEPTKEYPSDDFLVAAIVSRKPVSALGNGILGYFIVDKRSGVVTSMSNFEEVKEKEFAKIQAWMRKEHCIQADFRKNHFQSAPERNAHSISSEEKYYFVRDKYIQQFDIINTPINESLRGKSIGEQDRITRSQPVGRYVYAVLEELEDLITPVIGEVKVAGFPHQGKISLETLVKELGFGMVDGLKYSNLFVTTKTLLNNYLHANPNYPKDLEQLAKTGKFGSTSNFYSEVFTFDSSITTYVELPIKKSEGQSFASAYLGVDSMDISFYVPKTIFIIVSRGDRIFFVQAESKTKIGQNSQCVKNGEKLLKKSEKALAAYRDSDLKDHTLSEKWKEYEDQAYLEYQHCFGREAKKQNYFVPVTSQAQSIIDSL